jgi:chromate reductase
MIAINGVDRKATRLRVFALAGSLRQGSYNRRLLEAAVGLAPEEMTVEVYDALGSIPLFDEDLERATGGGPEAVRHLRSCVAAADGLLLATPEYNQSIPGVLKNALDWLSRPSPDEVLVDLPAAVVGVTAGRWGTRLAQSVVRQVLFATGALVMPAPALYGAGAAGLFDDAGRLTDPVTEGALRSVLASFASFVATHRRRIA